MLWKIKGHDTHVRDSDLCLELLASLTQHILTLHFLYIPHFDLSFPLSVSLSLFLFMLYVYVLWYARFVFILSNSNSLTQYLAAFPRFTCSEYERNHRLPASGILLAELFLVVPVLLCGPDCHLSTPDEEEEGGGV